MPTGVEVQAEVYADVGTAREMVGVLTKNTTADCWATHLEKNHEQLRDLEDAWLLGRALEDAWLLDECLLNALASDPGTQLIEQALLACIPSASVGPMWNLDQTIQKVWELADGTLCQISHGIAKRKVETITEILEAMAKGLQHDEEQWATPPSWSR